MRDNLQPSHILKMLHIAGDEHPTGFQGCRSYPQIILSRHYPAFTQIVKDFRRPPSHGVVEGITDKSIAKIGPSRLRRKAPRKLAPGDFTHPRHFVGMLGKKFLRWPALPALQFPVQRHKKCGIKYHGASSQGDLAGTGLRFEVSMAATPSSVRKPRPA